MSESQDIPIYRECGQVINVAWKEAAQNICSVNAQKAAGEMRSKVPECSKLRQG